MLLNKREGFMRRIWWNAALAMLWALPAAWCLAQTPAPVVAAGCARLFSAEQLRAALGATVDPVAQPQRDPKVLECGWARAGGATITLQYFDRKAIDANPVTHTQDGYFEMIVSASEEAVGKKREVVAGVVPRAVTVQGQTQLLLVVQRVDGVARILLGNITRQQAAALARAMTGS